MRRRKSTSKEAPTGQTIGGVMGPQSEEAKNNDSNGVETDPILDKIAKSRGINLQKLLKTLKRHPDELTDEEQNSIINFSSAILPKALERKMIEMYRDDRDKLNELLFNHNTRAATRLATVYNNKYARTAINRRYVKEDFLSAARYGLWQGARRFDLDRTYKGEPIKFITFATPWMFRYISEMLYEKENMIVHHSLDAKVFGDSNTTLGDMISADEIEQEDDDYLVNEQLSDDEANLGYEESHADDTLLQSIEGDLPTITGPLDENDPDSATKAQVDASIKAVNEMMTAKAPETPEGPEPINEQAISAIEKLCTEILNCNDPEERTITLFVGRKFIQAIVKKAAGRELPQSILNVHSMLKGVPANKKKLLTCLGLDAKEFNKLCKHYACKHINKDL